MIEVGEYVRTIDGYIFKVRKIERDENIYMISYHNDMNNYYTTENYEKIKHSKNLIDLIENGDVIEYILYTALENLNCIAVVDKDILEALKTNKDFKLLSVTTKEQFEAMKYKVEAD